MTRFNRSTLALFTLFCIFSVPQKAQENIFNDRSTSVGGENLFDFNHSLSFARYLNSTRQYNFATEEYERLHFFHPGDSTVMLELVRTYRLDQNCDRLDFSYDLFSEQNRLKHLPFTIEYLNFCLTCRSAHPSYFDLAAGLEPEREAFYLLSYYWRTGQYDSAFSYNREHAVQLEACCRPLSAHTMDFENQKYKSPFLALMMSLVIPGSGKAYAKRWGDAAISFIFVSTAAYASYRAFRKKGIRSFNGWLMGGVAFSFYSANLYGSHKSAVKYNNDVVTRYEDEARTIIYSNF